MDEPDGGCSWQAWKFGMKRQDLYTKLQDQYNTITLSIQDPDAFHHDVCEISKTANDLDQFHRMLEERKQLRLHQLNESLESASVEIIANPKLIGTDQWQHAIQLFRTRSFDSLVRYFSSYLPEDHTWNDFSMDSTRQPFFDELDDPTPIMTHEPLSFISATTGRMISRSHLPPSPRSLTTCSDSSSVSTPARTLSFSEPETDVMILSTTLTQDYDDDTSQWDDADTPTTPISEMSEMNPLEYQTDDKDDNKEDYDTYEQPRPSASLPRDFPEDNTPESTTPTPRVVTTDSYLSYDMPTKCASITMQSPRKYTPLQERIRASGPCSSRARRRSPEIGRIQKPLPDAMRMRSGGHKDRR